MTELRLPSGVRNLVGAFGPSSERHPGLLLDKLSPPGDMQVQKSSLDAVTSCTGGGEVLAILKTAVARHRQALEDLQATSFTATTAAPLTLHLSRANTLENAGLCLHPVHGFAYLPGSGIKGMTRAWAETVWLPAQSDRESAGRDIGEVFGRAATKSGEDSAAGAVTFHDALPDAWPKLQVEITNNHHPQYYGGQGEPGDWENPIPVYFLAIKPNTRFAFAVSLRRGVDERLRDRALEWLKGALRHAGAGAKTAAGYGWFTLDSGEAPPVPHSDALETFETTLELVTPAFLAGAHQRAEDCDLHPATLRGLLRWWWRTLHAGHIPLSELQRLEMLVWGGTGQGDADEAGRGSAVAIRIERLGEIASKGYDKIKIAKEFVTPNPRESLGLFYASYGMDDDSEARRRCFVSEGARWNVTLSVRPALLGNDRTIPAAAILKQAQIALWLLTRYGGVGSKARKGFGSLQDVIIDGIQERGACLTAARNFRDLCQIPSGRTSGAMIIEDAKFLEKSVTAENIWKALDHIGSELRDFASSLDKDTTGSGRQKRDKRDRIALGLPRSGQSAEKGNRHASPVWWRVVKDGFGKFRIRITGFPAVYLPDVRVSREMLNKLTLKYPQKIEQNNDLKKGNLVEVVLIQPEKLGKTWKARHEASGKTGAVYRWQSIPTELLNHGTKICLRVRFCNETSIPSETSTEFEWPKPQHKDEPPQPKSGAKPHPKGKGR